MNILVILAILLALILTSTPIPIALGCTAFLTLLLANYSPFQLIGRGSFEYLNNFSFLAVLFYIIMGTVMTRGKGARRLVDFGYSLVSIMPGGLAIAAVVACVLFGAISGSAIATLVAIGSIMYPALKERGYPEHFSVGLLTSAAELDILIPPSIPMIILAITNDLSVGRVYLAGYLPSLLFVASYAIYCYFYARAKRIPRGQLISSREIWRKLKASLGPIGLILLLLGGIYGGVFTAGESAALATVYAIVFEVFVYRSMSVKALTRTIIDATVTVGPLMFIVVGASLFGEYITLQKIPQAVMSIVTSLVTSPVAFLLIINVFLLIVGCFLDMLSSIIIITPVLFPIAAKFGIDPIHFAIIYIFNMGIGYITPPMGLDLYVSVGLFRIPYVQVVRGCLPFLLILIGDLLIITCVPSISLFLPNLFMGIVK